MATDFGLPSPACAAHVGKPIAGTSAVVDAYGLVVFNDTSLLNREGARTRWQDIMKPDVFESMCEAGFLRAGHHGAQEAA